MWQHNESGRLLRSLMISQEIAGLSRRGFIKGAAAAAGVAAFAPGTRKARAGATIGWMGWEEYGYPLRAGTYVSDNDITLEGYERFLKA